MIIKELIEDLKKYDENTIVIVWGENYTEPGLNLRREEYQVNYYTGKRFITIPPRTNFLVIQ